MITVAVDQVLVDKNVGAGREPSSKTPKESVELADVERQKQYWQAYRIQQARRACPGCGDDGMAF